MQCYPPIQSPSITLLSGPGPGKQPAQPLQELALPIHRERNVLDILRELVLGVWTRHRPVQLDNEHVLAVRLPEIG